MLSSLQQIQQSYASGMTCGRAGALKIAKSKHSGACGVRRRSWRSPALAGARRRTPAHTGRCALAQCTFSSPASMGSVGSLPFCRISRPATHLQGSCRDWVRSISSRDEGIVSLIEKSWAGAGRAGRVLEELGGCWTGALERQRPERSLLHTS